MHSSQPIGIFDSGIGGLTLASEITQVLPNESIIYFGDTAHLPYGDKSATAIQSYAVKICHFLLEKNCKLILIACNSASAAAYDLVKTYVGSKALVLNVIDPLIEHLSENWQNHTLGLIGTNQTVKSGIYPQKAASLNQSIQIKSLATPLLAPMIEAGFFNNSVSAQIIESYLKNEELKDIEGLILGCTHYPLIQKQIEEFYGPQVKVLNSAKIVANQVKEALQSHDLLNPSKEKGQMEFYVSDYTESFEKSTQFFFGEKIHLELFPIWD